MCARPILCVPDWIWLFVASLVASIILLWPFPFQLNAIALDTGDSLHEAWIIYWVQRSLTTPATAPFFAPANFPFTQAILINPPLYTSALLGGPLYWLRWSPIGVHNALILLSFVLSSWAVALLGRQLTRSNIAGLVAGLGYAFASIRMAHLAHLNLLSGYWTVLLLTLLLRLWRNPPARRWQRLALIGGCGLLAAAQALADVYNGIYMLLALVLLAGYQMITRRWGLSRRTTLALVSSFGLAALLCLAVLLPTLQTWRSLAVARDISDHDRYGARLENYLVPHQPSQLGYDLSRFQHVSPSSGGAEHTLWPGLITLGFAGLGLVAAQRSERQEQGYFVVLALAAFFLSLGPTIRVGEEVEGLASPLYRWLYDHAPLFGAARVPSRWALLLQLALAALAAYGVAALRRAPTRLLAWPDRAARGAATPRIRLARIKHPVAGMLALAAIGLVLADIRGAPVRGTTSIVGEPAPAVYTALANLPPGAMLEWPLENASPTLKHEYEYYTLFHQNPIVNSASSIVPERYSRLHNLLRSFPDDATTNLLRDMDVRYVNVNRYELGNWNALVSQLEAARGLRLLGIYENGRNYLYEVVPEQPALPPPSAEIIIGEAGPQLALQLAAPLWLDAPARYYESAQPATLFVQHTDGTQETVTLLLPPGLLPGNYLLPLPPTAVDATHISLGGQTVAVLAAPEQLVGQRVAGPQFIARNLPASATPNSVIPCRIYGKGPLPQSNLVLSVNLVNADWQFFAKHDRFFDEGLPAPYEWGSNRFSPIPCDFTIPANTPPGDYFLAIGLFDPASKRFVPIAGADGVAVEALWRIPSPIRVEPYAESAALAGAD
jgi:hypothetical protein